MFIVFPPPQTPRILEEHAETPSIVAIKLPKSTAFHVDAMVTKSITSTLDDGVLPPPKIPRVLEEQAAKISLAWVKLPKSVALPVDDIVIKSIVSAKVNGEGEEIPPPNNPRVDDEQAAAELLACDKLPKSTASPVDDKLI